MTQPTETPPTFKDENRALQELARELAVLRQHNLKFKEGDPQDTLLMFAEAAVVCMTMEHFVRIVLGAEAATDATLFNLLQMAVARDLIKVPWDDQQDGIKKIVAVRNSLLHGNYVQAARGAGCASVADYFRHQFAGEVETMTKITDFVVRQIDPTTGKRYHAVVGDPGDPRRLIMVEGRYVEAGPQEMMSTAEPLAAPSPDTRS